MQEQGSLNSNGKFCVWREKKIHTAFLNFNAITNFMEQKKKKKLQK